MIDAAVQNELKKFKARWAEPLSVSPVLALDDSWFSVSVIDAITGPIRQLQQLSEFEASVVRGSAAYLAAMAEKCWNAFGAEAEVQFDETGIVIRASKGPGLGKKDEVVIHVERDLRFLLESLPMPYRIFSTFDRVISPVDNFVSPFAFALFCGLSPTGEGPWAMENTESFAPNIEKVVKHLAVGAAESYGRMYPDEPIGQVPELYLGSLIYPMTLQAEDLPLRSAVKGLTDFFAEYKIGQSKAAQVTFNLAKTADERIAATGFVFASVLLPALSPEIRATAFSIGIGVAPYRRAMVDVREHFGIGGEWVGKGEYSETDAVQILREMDLGYFPWLKLSRARMLASAGDPGIQKMLAAFSDFNMKQAILAVDAMIDLTPDDMQIRLQRCFLDLANSEVDAAEKALKSLLSEPLAENEPMIYDLAGCVQMISRNPDAAEQYMKRARTLAVTDPILNAEVLNNYGWLELLRGNSEKALGLFNESLENMPDQLVALLNKATVLHQQKAAEAAELDRRLLELAPMNRQVFRALVYDAVATF